MAEESITWAIWAAGVESISTFIYVFSLSIAYLAGTYVLNPLVLAALAFLMPYFSFTIFPFFIIIFTAITKRYLFI